MRPPGRAAQRFFRIIIVTFSYEEKPQFCMTGINNSDSALLYIGAPASVRAVFPAALSSIVPKGGTVSWQYLHILFPCIHGLDVP